jgi:hypothetical protein
MVRQKGREYMTTPAWDELTTEARAVADTTRNELPDLCRLVEDIISLLAEGFTEAKAPNGDDPVVARMGLLTQNLGALWCSCTRARQGYYTPAAALLSTVYENWIACRYIIAKPEEAAKWLDADQRPPKHHKMLAALGDDLMPKRDQAKAWYDTLCRFAHTDAHTVLPHLGTHNGEAVVFFGAKFKPALFRSCVYLQAMWGGIMLDDVAPWISTDSEWHHRSRDLVERILGFLDQENAQFAKERGEPAH